MECDFTRPSHALAWLGIYTEEKKNPTTFEICWLCVSPNTLTFTHIFFCCSVVVLLLLRALRSVKLISSEILTIFLFQLTSEIETVHHSVSVVELGLSVAISSISFYFTCNHKDLLSSLCLIIICRIALNGNTIEFTSSEMANFIS